MIVKGLKDTNEIIQATILLLSSDQMAPIYTAPRYHILKVETAKFSRAPHLHRIKVNLRVRQEVTRTEYTLEK